MDREKLSRFTTRVSTLLSAELTHPSDLDALTQTVNQITSIPEIREHLLRLVQQTKLQQRLASEGCFTFNQSQVIDGLIHSIHLAHDHRSTRVNLPPAVSKNCTYLVTHPALILGRKLANH